MPRISRKRKNQIQKENLRPKYLAASYARVSVKNGGHGREETLNVQQEICREYTAKKPEIELLYEISDNGISGTTFVRDGFEQLMELVRSGKINCIKLWHQIKCVVTWMSMTVRIRLVKKIEYPGF